MRLAFTRAYQPELPTMNRKPLHCLLISSALMLPLVGYAQDAVPPVDAGVSSIDGTEIAAPVPTVRTVSLQAIQSGQRTLNLDWRQPEQVLRFDLSPTDKIETITLTVSGTMIDGTDADTPLQLIFNGSEIDYLRTSTADFSHKLTLAPKRARATGNEIRLRFASGCDDPQTAHAKSGGFEIDLSRSQLTLSSTPMDVALTIGDLEPRLSGPVFAPKTVGLIADGPMGTRFQSLAAQGLALRMTDIPAFQTQAGETDFDLVMATRTELAATELAAPELLTQELTAEDDLFALADDLDILTSTGPALILSRVHPNRLYITGDTADEVLQAVSAFATASLPDHSTRAVTPADILVQSPLDYDRRRVDGTIRLSSLSVQSGEDRHYAFDVSDPEAMGGDLVLHLNRDNRTAPGTKMIATLNGAELGRATLNGRRTTVSYPVRSGLLVGSDNRLVLTTVDGKDAPRCGAADPFIAIGHGSELRLETQSRTPKTDLSRLTANGSLFGAQNGANTVFILPEQDPDYETALQVVAQLAKASGRGWTSAEFDRGGTDDPDRHHLVIEPHSDLDLAYKGAAPQGMKAAWRGEPVEGRNRVAAYARLNGESAPAVGRIAQGGVAAIFPLDDTRLVGLITNTPQTRFDRVMAPLTGPLNWNGLAGGVSRWSSDAVVTTQLPLAMPEGDNHAPLASHMVPDPKVIPSEGLSIPSLNLPEVALRDAGDWLHRRWRDVSKAQAERKETQDAKAERERAKAMEARQTAPQLKMSDSDESNMAIVTDTPQSDFAARMDGGLLSQIDLWTKGAEERARQGELHPAILGLFLLLLGGLMALVMKRAKVDG